MSDNECVRKINAVTEKIFILPASSFCAGGESGHDACQVRGVMRMMGRLIFVQLLFYFASVWLVQYWSSGSYLEWSRFESWSGRDVIYHYY